jgi:beta-glucosidase/6-phospho-beta-glucosidase/beta-galactosidase
MLSRLGHLTGEHAPGLRLGLPEALLAGHHSLMAHGLSVQVIRAFAKRRPRIGWAPVTASYYPKTNSPRRCQRREDTGQFGFRARFLEQHLVG